jgi:hypothetical protein
MTTTIDNITKLIQMATIEQMYTMLQKMKNDNDVHKNKECNFSNDNDVHKNKDCNFSNDNDVHKNKDCNFSDENYSNQNNKLIGSLLNEINILKRENNIHTNMLIRWNTDFLKLSKKFDVLETDLSEIKNNTNNNSKFLCQQIRGQQLLTSYPGFSNGNQTEECKEEETHIKLKIEEKYENVHNVKICNEYDNKEEILEDESDAEDINPLMITCSTINLDKEYSVINVSNVEEEDYELSVEQELGIDCDIEEEEVASEDGSEEEEVCTEDETEEEEEVCTEDETESLGNNGVEPQIEEQNEEEEEFQDMEEKNKIEQIEVLKEYEEEEEEVFEIEIDDVTYFATDEENGILYEMTSDGDIGKKVGIIKDSEPIFN